MLFKKQLCDCCLKLKYSATARRIKKIKLILCSACFDDFKKGKIKLKEFDFTGDKNGQGI